MILKDFARRSHILTVTGLEKTHGLKQYKEHSHGETEVVLTTVNLWFKYESCWLSTKNSSVFMELGKCYWQPKYNWNRYLTQQSIYSKVPL